jgi:hypothetical protein
MAINEQVTAAAYLKSFYLLIYVESIQRKRRNTTSCVFTVTTAQ